MTNPDDATIVEGQYLKDKDRCAFGLGYEFRRRDKPLDDNPFPSGSWKYEMFTDGWRAKNRLFNSKP